MATVATHRFTVTEYEKMAEAGILRQDQRIELIEGEIVDMSPIGKGHMARVDRLNELFMRGVLGRAIVRIQGSVRLGEHLEPQPDLVLLRYRADFYADVDAGSEDVLLIVEVADTSLPYDRDVKAPLYARAGVPEFWLLDLNGESVRVHRQPRPQGYREQFDVRGAEPLSPQAFPELVLTPGQVLGSPGPTATG